MNLDYFIDNITEELEGSIAYIKMAAEVRAMNPNWAKIFVDMSSTELTHATSLFKMLEEYYSRLMNSYNQNLPDWMSEQYEHICKLYLTESANIKHMHEVYNM